MPRKRKPGRAKGGRKQGYFFRKGRGWYITAPGEPKLCDLEGQHLKSPDDTEAAALAYARLMAGKSKPVAPDCISAGEACQLYLAYLQRHGSEETYRLRSGLLFDFCSGFPAAFKDRLAEVTEEDRIHNGYGPRPLLDLTPADVEDWVAKHPGWKSNRAAVQAVRRAINYCVKDKKLIPHNPIRGVKVDRVGKRMTYFTPDVEEALYKWASPALGLAIRFGINAGTRPVCEFGSVEHRHVQVDDKGNMVWHFPPGESKVRGKDRYVQIPRSLKPLVDEALKQHPTGKLFLDDQGRPWTEAAMKGKFRKLRDKLLREKVPIEKTDVMYTTRHTYAKRQLGGYWTGEPVSIEVLAGLMGNTPDVCWKHYGQWSVKYMEPLRRAVDY